MPRSILAAVTPDNTPGGSLLTLIFPLGLGVIVAVVLYLRFSRPHRRVPDRPVLVVTHLAVPDPEVAAAAAVAAGLPTAAGGGGANRDMNPQGRHGSQQPRRGRVTYQPGNPARPRCRGPSRTTSAQDPSAADGTEAGE